MSDRTLPFTVNLDWSTVNWVKQRRYALTLKTPKKYHPKIPSTFVVCCKFLLHYFTKLSIETNSVDPDKTASIGAVLYEFTLFVGKASKTFQQTTKAVQFFYVIGALRVNRAKQLNRRRQIRLVCPVNVRRKNINHTLVYEPVHGISNRVVCATSKASDQPAHMRRLIRAFASRLSTL